MHLAIDLLFITRVEFANPTMSTSRPQHRSDRHRFCRSADLFVLDGDHCWALSQREFQRVLFFLSLALLACYAGFLLLADSRPNNVEAHGYAESFALILIVVGTTFLPGLTRHIHWAFAATRPSDFPATRRSVTGEVDAAFYEFQARQTEVSLYRDKLAPSARQLESLAEDSYKAGRSNILVVIEAQREVQQTQREYLQSLLELQQAFADLEQVVGVSLD